MKIIAFLTLGIAIIAVFALQPVSVFAQSVDTEEQERIKELQAIVIQLLKLVAELQQQLLVVRQTSLPVPETAGFGEQAQVLAVPACGQAEIAWGSASGAADYVLYRNGFEVYSGKNLRFIDTGLMPSAQYVYTVRARNAGGLGPVSPAQTITISSQCPPSIPVVWAQEGMCGGNVQISWSKAEGADFYEVFRGNTRVFSGTVPFFTDRGLVPGNSYIYKVRAGNSGGLGQFSQEINAKASVVCPPAAPKTIQVGGPLLENGVREGIFDVAIRGSPSGATVQSENGGVDILSFQVSAKLSPIVVNRVDAEFSDRPWLFLSSAELREGGRVLSKIEVSQDSFVQVGDSSYRIRFANFAVDIPEGGNKTISVRVVAKEGLLLAEPRQLTVSITANSVLGRDGIGVMHYGPDLQEAQGFVKTFFVKRK